MYIKMTVSSLFFSLAFNSSRIKEKRNPFYTNPQPLIRESAKLLSSSLIQPTRRKKKEKPLF